MPLGVYKPGQGKWSRGIAAIGLAALGLWAAIETYDWMSPKWLDAAHGYLGYVFPAILLLGFVYGAWRVANRAPTTDFIIETEIEMKKVTWPTVRDVAGSTVVVIVVMVMLGLFMYVLDLVLVQWAFKPLGIF